MEFLNWFFPWLLAIVLILGFFAKACIDNDSEE